MATSRAARPKRKAGVTPSPEELARQLQALRETLRAEGAIKLSAIGPKGVREGLAAQLASEGYERSPTWLRRPLCDQAREVLAHGAVVGKKDLARLVRGGSAAELTRVLSELERAGALRRVLRGKTEAFAGAEARVLGLESLRALHGVLSQLAKLVAAASKKKGVTLLASDVEASLEQALEVLPSQAVSGAVAPAPDEVNRTAGAAANGAFDEAQASARDASSEAGSVAATGAEASPRASVLDALDATRDERTGLSFVPRLMQRLLAAVPLSVAHEVLLAAARDEVIELRPEGGLGRLSAEELQLCPPGPGGTRLSWARRVEALP